MKKGKSKIDVFQSACLVSRDSHGPECTRITPIGECILQNQSRPPYKAGAYNMCMSEVSCQEYAAGMNPCPVSTSIETVKERQGYSVLDSDHYECKAEGSAGTELSSPEFDEPPSPDRTDVVDASNDATATRNKHDGRVTWQTGGCSKEGWIVSGSQPTLGRRMHCGRCTNGAAFARGQADAARGPLRTFQISSDGQRVFFCGKAMGS